MISLCKRRRVNSSNWIRLLPFRTLSLMWFCTFKKMTWRSRSKRNWKSFKWPARSCLLKEGAQLAYWSWVWIFKELIRALKLLSSVRDIHLRLNFHGNPKFFEIPSLKWDSFKRAVIHQFKEKTLNSLVEGAPLFRELILEGRVVAENGEFTEKLKISWSSIRLLDIGLSEVEEIKLMAEEEGREIIIMRGNNQTKFSVVCWTGLMRRILFIIQFIFSS